MLALRRAAGRTALSASRSFSSHRPSVIANVSVRPSSVRRDYEVLRIGFASSISPFSSGQYRLESEFGADHPLPDAAPGPSETITPRRMNAYQRSSVPAPSSTVYVGNLFFSVSEKDLEKEMSRVGPVSKVTLIYDARGLSKGFGFVQYEDVETAQRAIEELSGQYFEGRPLTVQYGRQPVAKNRPEDKGSNPPSRTLFIGNLAYDMSDRDLNDLFRNIRNVTDVRVAIDRRTGQPRGFAHADFTDVESAVEAKAVLEGKQVFDRKLRIDFSTNSTNSGYQRQSNPEQAGAADAGAAGEQAATNVDATETRGGEVQSS